MKNLFAVILATAMVAAPLSADVVKVNAAELDQAVAAELAKVLENGTDAEKAMVAKAMQTEASKNALYAKIAVGVAAAAVGAYLGYTWYNDMHLFSKKADAGKSADKLADADKTADKKADKTADKTADKPADKTADKPADKTADTPADKTADTPADKPADKTATGN